MNKLLRSIILAATVIVAICGNAQKLTSQNLSEKQQAIIKISALAGKGDLQQLKNALIAGLESGLTVNQIKEVIIHVYAYAGFPRSIRGLQTFIMVLDERKSKGFNDVTGNDASPIRDERNKYDRGKAILDSLTGKTQTGPQTGYSAFAPQIEIFLKEHLFADIFERDVLSYAERELVTVSVLSSLVGLEPMLQSHLNICLNVGLTPPQLKQFVQVVKPSVGKKKAKAANRILEEILKTKE